MKAVTNGRAAVSEAIETDRQVSHLAAIIYGVLCGQRSSDSAVVVDETGHVTVSSFREAVVERLHQTFSTLSKTRTTTAVKQDGDTFSFTILL